MPLLPDAMAAVAAAVEAELDLLLPPVGGPQARLHEAMRYAMLGGGKRLRPFLVAATGEMFGVPARAATRAGAAVELIHGYSLAHDDLPAMDDAALRRGRPACHRAFDEATAILAGDALQALAFEALARPGYDADAGQRCALVAALAGAAGALGMCGGQMVDLVAEGRRLTLPEVGELQRLKTGAIITFACEAGAILGRAAPAERAALLGYGEDVGLAFQIRDDLLDAEGNSAALGKDAGRDLEAGKATFVQLLGEDGAKAKLAELRSRALSRLDIFGPRATVLEQLFDFVVNRQS
ncbi:MAG TPA: farnesyl diphosphate synthase [Geminicoccaceae bacterium]|nr:farnesyl diphosphate synthase [Geminicoccaceae bacterium]